MTIELSAAARQLLDVQRGVIACWQAPAVGLELTSIKSQARSGRWQRLQLGVVATFTGEPGREAQLWAAVLRAGPGAVLSHQTAAELDGLACAPSPAVHVSVPVGRHLSMIPGVRVHRSVRVAQARHPSRLPPRTRIEDTVLDLTQSAASYGIAFSLLCEACGSRLTTPQRLTAALAARPKVRWRTAMSLALADIGAGLHSALEVRYVRDVEQPHRLPRARRQARMRQDQGSVVYLDNYLDKYRVCIELDGRAAHPAARRWRDIGRDNASAAAGISTLRYSWADVTERPCETARQIAEVLRQRGWPGRPRPCSPTCPVLSRPSRAPS
ncbi:MAG TPA: hypothetical protein VH637_12425 [Streptosporangiaceae bacterium]|jgi:very-short-patch-repair endonuclease